MNRRRLGDAHGFTMVELSIVLVILGILFVIASAMFVRARMSGNEASAIAALRSVSTAQFAYLNGCGNGFYATSFEILGDKNSRGYISEDLATSAAPERSGYRFAMMAGTGGVAPVQDCMGRPVLTSYYASAVPVAPGNTGSRAFAVNPSGAVWQLQGSTPPAEPFGPPAVPAE